MPVKEFEVPDIGTVYMYKRRGSRNMRLSVTSNGVRVTMPSYIPYGDALAFVESKRAWLITHLQTTSQPLLESGQRIGKEHVLRFHISFKADKPTNRVQSGVIVIQHPARVDSTDPAVQAVATKAAIRALRSEAEAILPGRLRAMADKHGFAYKSVSVKRLKGRWGSCDQHTNIVLNLFLMQLPWQLIDYVLMHELIHTKHLDHGNGFWDEFISNQPLARTLRKEMREYQPRVTPKKA